MVEAGYVTAGTEIKNVSGSVQAGAASVRKLVRCCRASGYAVRAQRGVCAISATAHEELHIRLVIALQNVVLQAVELVPELEIVRTSPSALEPGQVCVVLQGLVRVPAGERSAVWIIKETGHFLQWGGQRMASVVGGSVRKFTVALPDKQCPVGRVAAVSVVFEVVAQSGCSHQPRRQREVSAEVDRDVRSNITDVVRIGRWI